MKKIILTLVALLVSAVMVLAFAGCAAKETVNETSTSDNGAVVTTIENETAADVTEADSTSSFVA